MGIPVKGSRKLDFQGHSYRYLIRMGDARFTKGRPKLASGCRVVTAQRVGPEGKPTGQVLQATVYAKAWYEIRPGEDFEDEATLTPMDVKHIVNAALILGWDPKGKGVYPLTKGIDLPEWESSAAS